MFIKKIKALAALLVVFSASAQTPARVETPPSAFADYKLYSEKNPSIDWRSANNLMEKLDGHMGHVRGGPRSKKPMSDAPPPKPAMSEPAKTEMKKP